MEIENENIFLIVHLGLILCLIGLNIIINKSTSYLISNCLALLYIIIRILYIYDIYPIFRYEDIDKKNKYYGLFTNTLVIDDIQAFYINYILIYTFSIIIENSKGKTQLITIWSIINIISPLVTWLYHRQLYL